MSTAHLPCASRWLRGFSVGLLALLFSLDGFSAAGPGAGQYETASVKAAFLYRFTGYVEWPKDALAVPAFQIAVIGDDEVTKALNDILEDRRVKGLPPQVQVVSRSADMAGAHLLYIGEGYTGDLGRLIAGLGTRPVLVVADHPQGLDEGAALNFRVVEQRVRFEVSLSAAQRAGLRISSALLSVAVRVRGT